MKLNRSSRGYRLVVGFILPPVFGAVIVMAISLVEQLHTRPQQFESINSIVWVLSYFPLMLLGAMIFVGIQSLVYSLVMEFVVRPGVSGRSSFLVAGGFLGFFAALAPANQIAAPETFLPIGIVVGVIVGLIICDKEQ
jgi:hypothetical protein